MVAAGALGAGLVACGGDDDGDRANADCPRDPPPVINDSFPEPEVRRSENGELETTLRASYSEVELAGKSYQTMNYEGTVPGPTLEVCPGDRLKVRLENALEDAPPASVPRAPGPEVPFTHDHTVADRRATNLHTHGFHVRPGKNPDGTTADNVFIDIPPGEDATYEYDIPRDHPPGAYWYHPHRHGNVEGQIFAGMLGSIVMRGGLDEVPELKDVPVRNLVIHYTQLGKGGRVVPVERSADPGSPGAKPGEQAQLLLNGAATPEIPIRPGEVQRWRITNANDNPILNLSLKGHRLYALADDGNTLERIKPVDNLLIGPSERREVLVVGGRSGRYELETKAFSQFQGGRAPAAPIATMVSGGAEVNARLPKGVELSNPEDLTAQEVEGRHRIVFTEKPVSATEYGFFINGKRFDPNRIDQRMKLNEVHEWSLKNATKEWHSFHIHINNFQVTGLRGKAPKRVSDASAKQVGVGAYQDTVMMPPGKTVTFRTKPTNFGGKFVFHCHMTNHEDRGMMGVVRVAR